jgi:hypothetical protein
LALVGGRSLRIEGGNVRVIGGLRFHCPSCRHEWETAKTIRRPESCPSCEGGKIHAGHRGRCCEGRGRGRRGREAGETNRETA